MFYYIRFKSYEITGHILSLLISVIQYSMLASITNTYHFIRFVLFSIITFLKQFFISNVGIPQCKETIHACSMVLAHMVLSVWDMFQNAIQYHVSPGDPFASCVYFLIIGKWMRICVCKCRQIEIGYKWVLSLHVQVFFRTAECYDSDSSRYFLAWS